MNHNKTITFKQQKMTSSVDIIGSGFYVPDNIVTNKDLEKLIKRERFRKDLFFRLCVVQANIPSLNERRDDILPLAKYFLHEFNEKFKKNLFNSGLAIYIYGRLQR